MAIQPKVIALGFFDGVHLGHGALLRRTAAEAKQIERRAEAGSLEAVMPGLYARPEYWSELKFRQRYLHRVRALAQKHPDWTFCSYTAAVIYGLSVSHANLTHIHIAAMPA